jgi:hypothetical protein
MIPAYMDAEFGHIYIIALEDHHLYKIGKTRDEKTLRSRFNGLRGGCPYYLYVDSTYLVRYPYTIERRIHLALEDNWVGVVSSFR